MNTLKMTLFLLILTLLSLSCSDRQVFRLDVLKPGYIVVPSQKKSIVIIDNTGLQPKNAGHVVKVNYNMVQDTGFQVAPLSGMLINSLANYLLKEGFYQKVTPYLRGDVAPAKMEEDDFLRSGRLSPSVIMNVSKDTSLHLLFSLDRLLTKTVTNSFFSAERGWTATRDVWVNSVWRIYDLDVDTLISQFQYNDSMYWKKTDASQKVAVSLLPKMSDVLPEISDVVAEHVNKFFGPHWVTEKREYFSTGGYRMKMAADLVRKNQIDEAAELWKTELVKGYSRSKYRAAINMMFFEEVKGHPKEALAWLEKADAAMKKCPIGGAYYDMELLKLWKKMLVDRLADFEKLKIYFDGNLN